MHKTVVFCLAEFFPYGGLQRDFLRIALGCQRRGASIRVYTLNWEGDIPSGFDVRIVPVRAWSNHRRMKKFAEYVQSATGRQPSAMPVVGFNKMPGLDVYFAADSCFAARTATARIFLRLLPRYRTYLKLEQAIFSARSETRVLLIAPEQQKEFQRFYPQSSSRCTLLPPGLNPAFRCSDPQRARNRIREEFKLRENDLLLLQVGSSFNTKGVDRVIRALAVLPEPLRRRCVYLAAGNGDRVPYLRLAERLGVSGGVRFAGVRQDIPELMAAADLLVHPARTEAAGMTLIESLASGLPVICSGVCGYAPYVAESGAGIVLPEPFRSEELNRQLKELLDGGKLSMLGKKACDYAGTHNLSGMHEKATDIILQQLNNL